MLSSRQQPLWRRIYRQTITLIHKNFLIFYATAFSTIARALLFPIIVTLVLSFLKFIQYGEYDPYARDDGIATSSTPIKDLADAMRDVSRSRLVFARNGTSSADVDPIIDAVFQQPGMEAMDTVTIDDPNDVWDYCKQTLSGESTCYAAVVFVSYTDKNVEYAIAIDSSFGDNYLQANWKNGDTWLNRYVLPLQWAIDSHIGGFSTAARPSTRAFEGYFGPNAYFYDSPSQDDTTKQPVKSARWLSIIASWVAPLFILITIGVVFHLSTFVATERETSMAELMAAQKVSITPRILSTFISFFVVYFPGFLISSILMTQILFQLTSDVLLLVLTLLSGASLITASHFVASLFGKAQLAGLTTSTLTFALALISLTSMLTVTDPHTQIVALCLLFPPITWTTMIGDIAGREKLRRPFGFDTIPKDVYGNTPQVLDGYLYLVFFIVQIVLYSVATYGVEHYLWGVRRSFDRIDASSDVAVRCTGLSKTYHAKRLWYWPFKTKGKTVLAVDKLDLEIKKGSVTFLLGPNGGGKTTTLKCVAGMVAMDSGSKLELNEDGLVFGICPQNNVFWQSLTVEQHINIWRKLKTAAFEDVNTDDDDVLAECDLLEKVQAPAKTLSGGQMRKLQLAISFVGGSKVCCIDEASSGLDPLSRRNIWNIIQKGHARRTILVTTHFLDEADVLADHIVIVYKGKLVCEGPGTSLKSRFGDNYVIRSNSVTDGDNMVWRTTNSAEATRKILELEAVDSDDTYNIVFPTLEQVFLKVTSDGNTAVHENGGDGFVGEEQATTVIDEKIFALENENSPDINLDVGHSIGLARQVVTLFKKRYILLLQKAGWISYGISLIIPIIIAGALAKFIHQLKDLETCAINEEKLLNGSSTNGGVADPRYPLFSYYSNTNIYDPKTPVALLGPRSAWTGPIQDDIFSAAMDGLIIHPSNYDEQNGYLPSVPFTSNETLNSREFIGDLEGFVTQITNYSGNYFQGFGIYTPTPETTTFFYKSYGGMYASGSYIKAFSLLTNHFAQSSTTTGSARIVSTQIKEIQHATNTVSLLVMPISVLVCLGFIAAASIAVIYPAYEKINRVRALHYCNGVSPFALWSGYLLFDMQLIIIQAIITWGVLYTGPLSRVWYASDYLLGVFILFGIATYLGTYVLSLFLKKAAFAIAAGVHVLLFVLYLVSYIMNQSFGDLTNLHQTYTSLQVGLGLSSPAANLIRALFVASNSFEILCGKYGINDISNPGSYDRYGGVYTNLLIQIVFLIAVLAIYEYGSADWFRRNVTHRGIPARLHYIIESGDPAGTSPVETEKNARAIVGPHRSEILNVSRVSKFFGKVFAVENVSFDIAANETLALLGGNGAGKTTCINMIRGELKPNFGDILLDGTSVLRQPHKARMHMGVCPQDDAIDNLSVRQTLNFYATVKGLKNVTGNVDNVLDALNISMFQNVQSKDLSGGTRRKLSVAIALLGNPRVLLLDEPSTGQDAGAKRILWKALQDISANRAILLTTHSMEEAEALATNVAIMGTKMLATGTLPSLQETYGGAYSVRAVRAEGTSAEEVEAVVKERFEGMVSSYTDSHGQVSWRLPHDKKALGSIMRVMEALKGDAIEDEEAAAAAGGSSGAATGVTRYLEDYTVAGPTLEEVFMNVAREGGVAGGA